jgi:hypothetical protein
MASTGASGVLSIHNPAFPHWDSLPHTLRQDLLGRPSGCGHAEPGGLQLGAGKDVIQEIWTRQMRGGDNNLERSPMNQLFGSHCHRAIGGAEHHVGATAKQPAQIFTDEHRGAATLCHDGQTVGHAGPTNPGTDLRSVVNEGNQLEEGKFRGKRKGRAGEHAAQCGRSSGRHNQCTAESAVLARESGSGPAGLLHPLGLVLLSPP